MEIRIDRREKSRMVGLVCRYMPIDWIPAPAPDTDPGFAGMTRYGFGFNKLVMLPNVFIKYAVVIWPDDNNYLIA